MRWPAIVVWTYLALGVLLLDNLQDVIFILNEYRMFENDKPILYEVPFDFLDVLLEINAALTPVFIVAILFSTVGLARRSQWARITSFVTVGGDALLMFVIGSYIIFDDFVFPIVEPLPEVFDDSAISPLLLGLRFMAYASPFLYLAYKIYSSEPLKIYLEARNK